MPGAPRGYSVPKPPKTAVVKIPAGSSITQNNKNIYHFFGSPDNMARQAAAVVSKSVTTRPGPGSADMLERQAIAAQNKNGKDGGNSGAPVTANTSRLNANQLDYNVGMVIPSYHTERLSGLTGQSTDKPALVESTALGNQFSSEGLHKGMLVTWVPSNPDTVVPSNPNSGDTSVQLEGRYGFQFHYNPTKFTMNYAGQPDIDLGLLASGNDPFNLTGASVSQSTISNFVIPINRVADMSYYDPKTKHLKAGISEKLYAPRQPSLAEQERIYEYGTMYDIEYLLSAVLGFKMETKYRKLTSDLGFIAGRPVEIILGKNLHYLGWISGISVNHEIFDQRMVPTWSTVSLTINRIPDYPKL